MTSVLIATFSQTGSTQKVADQIDKGLSSSGFEISRWEIKQGNMPDISGFEIIGIGTPAYFFRPPFVTVDFVNQLPALENKSFCVFVTHGTSLGDCGNRIRKMLASKGGRDLGYFHCFGADYWMGYIKRGTMFSPDSPDEVELAHAERFGQKVAARFASGSGETEKHDSPTHFIYRFEKIFVSRLMARYVFPLTFYADKLCDLCGLCVKNCPVGNIEISDKGKLKWHEKCLLCATCELCCPKDTIHSGLDWPMFAPFMLYNIRRSMKKGIPYLSVIHSKGETLVLCK